jgi:hypothetical protein
MIWTKLNRIFYLAAFLWMSVGCTKLVQVPEPVNTITTAETFSTDANATSAVVGIYNDMISGENQVLDYGNGMITIFAGMTSDELQDYGGYDPDAVEFQNNKILAQNGYLPNLWNAPYYDVYICNAAVEGLTAASSVTPSVKNELLGEAEFLRAFIYFYLVNMYGDPPLVTSTAWLTTEYLQNSTSGQIYQQIVTDLQGAIQLLPGDYSISAGGRYRANKWAAVALLARVYLYQGLWQQADSAASAVLANGSLFSLESDPNQVFLAGSSEAILQLIPNATSAYATPEGHVLVPSDPVNNPPVYIMTPQLVAAFEPSDLRWTDWVDSSTYGGSTTYFPYKYKVYTSSVGNVTEYYMLLRFAEQYLIRAEAEANMGQVGASVTDLNAIRQRAQLPLLSDSLTQTQVIAAVMHERQIELFSEWGHRWFDLKRTGAADSVCSAISYKQPWSMNDLLWPVPYGELQADPKLQQNQGY